ncbi:hypothetical protein [Rhizobium leguminosarum]|uniref:hypothetical protein n=1 Tax=Rhizobium leguminosarum TaxID=384 RepID=UPI0028163543|nr:hypothetical protein [Rhizobium leguminosarum]
MRGNHFIETGSVWKSREGIRSCRRTQRKFDFVLVSNTRGDIEKDFDVERNIIHNRALCGNQCRNDRAVGVPDIDLLQHIASILREHAMSAITCRAADGSLLDVSVLPRISSHFRPVRRRTWRLGVASRDRHRYRRKLEHSHQYRSQNIWWKYFFVDHPFITKRTTGTSLTTAANHDNMRPQSRTPFGAT